MKANKVKIYAEALSELALDKKSEGPEQSRRAKRFLNLLEKDGLQKKAKEIVALAEDIILQKQGKQKIVFETARKITASQKKLLHEIAREGDRVEEKINPDLIAGVKIVVNGNKQYDNSLKNKLEQIFK